MSDPVPNSASVRSGLTKGPDGVDSSASEAARYADYLQTFEGRLRLDSAWDNLRDFIEEALPGGSPARTNSGGERRERSGLRALDMGAGTGATALRLAERGWDVTLLDASAPMLALAAETARRAGLGGRVTPVRAEAAAAGDLFGPGSFDAAICHNLLEYVEDAGAVFAALGAVVRPGGVVSVLARNRAGEVMRAALNSHDLEAARRALAAPSVTESLWGREARLFDAATLRALASVARLEVLAVRGVRVLAEYLPASCVAGPRDYERLLAFERELGAREEFAAVARYTQVLARRADDA